MPPTKFPKVPQSKISSIDLNSFIGGLDQRGVANIRPDSLSASRNAMITPQGLVTHRLVLKRWLPDLVGTVYQVFPALYEGVVYFITADDGKIKYCQTGDAAWTNCGGTNNVTTPGTVNTFIRVQNKVLILNGQDNLGYVDLTKMQGVQFSHVNDPTLAPTGTLNGGLTNSPYKVYYCISYNSVVGKTISSPILTQGVSKIREQWATDGTQGVTITDTNVRPAGAVSWNVYLATAPAGVNIQLSDMLPIALGLDISTTTFTDTGKITQLTNAGTAPDKNSTDGPKAKYGIEIEGRPFLYGIKDDPYAVLIGGNDQAALDFTEGSGGYRLVLNEGTNYYPQSVVGFRNGQGIPSITVLFSNTEGLSKQSIIEQQTVSLGTFSATIWGNTEQNYGAAGVSSPYAVVNYRGKLVLPTTDGLLQVDTEASLQNVLSPKRISDPVIDEVSSIKTELLPNIVGTAWANRMMFSIPARGFNYNNEILVYDVTRKDAECFYTFDIKSQWIGTVSPPGAAGFVYVCQDNHVYRLDTGYVAQDESSTGTRTAFPVEATSALIGTNTAHNAYYAVVQAVAYIQDFIGTVNITATWRDYQSGQLKSKTKTVTNGVYVQSSAGGWSSPGYLFNQKFPTEVLMWSDLDVMTGAQALQKKEMRVRIPLNNVVTNEMQISYSHSSDNSALIFRSASFEGQPLGVSPDVR